MCLMTLQKSCTENSLQREHLHFVALAAIQLYWTCSSAHIVNVLLCYVTQLAPMGSIVHDVM